MLPVSLALLADLNRNFKPSALSEENPPVSFVLPPMSIYEIHDRWFIGPRAPCKNNMNAGKLLLYEHI